MQKQAALCLLLLATAPFFAACKDKDKAPNGPSLCPSDSGMNETEAFVCRLYREFPPLAGPDTRKPTPEFLEYFTSELRGSLGKLQSPEAVLYGTNYQSLEYLSGFHLKFHERSGKMEVRYKEFDRPQKLDFLMGKQNGKWLVSDIRYPDDALALSLRECLRPHISDSNALTADYTVARRRYRNLIPVFDGGWDRYPEDKQNSLLDEKNRLLAFLNEHVKDVIPISSIEGFRRDSENNVNSCVYDQNICANLEGVRFSSDGDGDVVVTNKSFLRDFVGRDNPSLDPNRLVESDLFTEVLIQEAQFINMGDLAVTKPDSLDFLRVVVGYSTQDGTGSYPPGSAYFVATKGDRVFVGGLYFDEGTFPRIPLCETGFKQGLEAQGFKCEDFYCNGQDSTNASVFQAAEKTYATCYIDAMVNEPFYPAMLAKMQSIVNRVAAAH